MKVGDKFLASDGRVWEVTGETATRWIGRATNGRFRAFGRAQFMKSTGNAWGQDMRITETDPAKVQERMAQIEKEAT